MAKYFYVYEIAGSPADRMVKMFNTESVIDDKKSTYIAEKKVAYKDLQGFTSGIKAVGFQLNPELANADIAEQEAKRILAAKMADYHAARDAYAEAADNLKKVNAKFGIV